MTSPFPPSEPPFRVSDLKQWVYCPRILYYHVCLPAVRPVTYKMEAGVEAGRKEEGHEVRRSLRKYGIRSGKRAFNLRVSSPHLGLRGVVDMVIWPEDEEEQEIIPVDYKMSRKAGHHFKLQLAAYGLMLEETFGLHAKRGFLYFIPLRKSESIRLDARLRKILQEELAAMKEAMWVSERMPPPTPHRRKCVACEFRRFCNDVV